MKISKPFNLQKWIDDNRDLLKPPVGNKKIYVDNDDFIVMIVGGPNGRKDYHYQDMEELFYQLEGDIVLKIINEDGEREDIPIKEGEMFLLPPHVPHSSQRPAGTVGLVLEIIRKEGQLDKLFWYCENCNHKLHEATFEMKDIVNQLTRAINDFMDDEEKRTCENCGNVMEKAS